MAAAKNGNVIDLGEKVSHRFASMIDRKLKKAGVRAGLGKPFLAGRSLYEGRKHGLGRGPMHTVKMGDFVAGGVTGTVANRTLARAIPALVPVTADRPLLVDGISFLLGLSPLLFARNSFTVGVAVPGAVFLGGRLLGLGLDFVWPSYAPPAAARQSGPAAAAGARERLLGIQERMASAGRPPAAGIPRVVAEAVA